ncbi:MAG: hypothetical protein RLY87_1982 [Chloroflexota bacterium]
MIPLTLKMQNFLSYKNETPEFDFSTFHIACLSGDNGAGKSSFLEAIHWAVWGEARLRDAEILNHGAERMFVEFVFSVGGIIYRINRSYAKTTRGGTRLELYQASDATRTRWDSLTAGTIRETQAKITNEIVGMSYAVFSNSAYLRQGESDAFTKLPPTERRDLLAQMLEIDRYNTYRERAKTKRDELTHQIAHIKGQMAVDEANVANIASLSTQLSDAEERVAQARSFVEYAASALARQTARQSVQQLSLQLTHYTQRLGEVEAESALVAQQLARRDDILQRFRLYTERESQYSAMHAARQQYDALVTQKQHADQAVVQRRALIERTLDRATAERQQLLSALAQADSVRAEATELAETLAHAEADQTALETAIARRDACIAEIRTHDRAIDRLQALTQEHTHLTAQRNAITASLTDLQSIQEQLTRCDDATVALSQLQSERATEAATQARLLAEQQSTADAGIALKRKRDAININEHCPTCQTLMDEAHYNAAHATLTSEIEELRTMHRSQSQAVREAHQRIAALESSIAEYQLLASTGPTLRQRIAQLNAKQLEADRLDETLSTLAEQISAIQASRPEDNRAQARATLQASEADVQILTQKVATLHANQRRMAQLEADIARFATQQQRILSLDGSIAGFESDLANDRIDPDAQALSQSLNAQIAALGYDPAAASALWDELQGMQDAREEHNQLVVLDTRAAALVQRTADTTEQLNLAQQAKAQAEYELQRLEARCAELLPHLAGRDVTAAPAQLVTIAEVEVTSRTDYASQLRVKLQSAYQSQERLEAFHTQLQQVTVLQGRYDILERAFASKGIQAMLIRDFAIPALERETNRILSRMSDNQLYLSFNTHMVTQAGNPRETLELVVSDAVGTRSLEAFSGGEAFRISFALRVALSKILAHRAGHRLETLIIDEGFGTQDAQGRERLVEAINSISSEFHTILVITHVQEVKDLFPVQIHIKRDEQGSAWEVLS